ncbi:MAG: hypothetical protein IKI03_03700, partial [Clostridia bacterium]|nr:hypothetical protein [Clostridia bacterium]
MSERFLKIVPNYENSVAVIPSRVIEYLNDATGDDMAVLIVSMRDGAGFDPDAACRELGITKKTLDSAIRFWEKNGIISVDGSKKEGRSVPFGKKNASAESPKESKGSDPRPQRTEVPPMTTEEVARFLEENERIRLLIKDVEKSFGKILTRAEVNTLVAIIDHLSLDP